MDYDWRCYLNEDQVINTVSKSVPTTWVQILPANPMRRRLLLPTSVANAMTYMFSDVSPSGFSIQIPTTDSTLILTWDQLGDYITYPLWGASGTATQGGINVTEISVSASRWSKYRRYLDAELSRY